MQRLLLIILFLFPLVPVYSQNNCRSYIEKEVIFVRTEHKIDWEALRKENPGAICIITGDPVSYHIRCTDTSFQIISFIISAETGEDIMEANCQGSELSSFAKTAYGMANMGSDIYFSCIKAKHKSGKIFTLKPFSIKK